MRIVAIIFAAFFLAGSVAAQSESQKTKIKAEIQSVIEKQVVAWNSGDVDGFMKGYWNSSELLFVSGDNVTRGWQPTLDRYKKSYDTREKMGTLKFSGLEITVVSPAAAVVLGSWALERPDNPHGKFTLTFRKFKDGWRIVIDHTS